MYEYCNQDRPHYDRRFGRAVDPAGLPVGLRLMFEERTLSSHLEDVRAAYAADTLVFNCSKDFETLPPSQAEELGLVVDSLEPATYPTSWLPEDAPQLLYRYAGSEFTIGMPGDGSIVWTRQTDPPIVIVKPRIEGSPEAFVEFLIANAFVELDCECPEHFLGFFEDEYSELAAAAPIDPTETYQIAAALFDGWMGLHTRQEFSNWEDSHPELAAAWHDAGTRLENRVSELPRAVARGETEFADATELACGAIKHAIELPAPFDALDTRAYREHGSPYAIQWVRKTFDALEES